MRGRCTAAAAVLLILPPCGICAASAASRRASFWLCRSCQLTVRRPARPREQRAEAALGGAIPAESWSVHVVRDVAPNKARGTRRRWRPGPTADLLEFSDVNLTVALLEACCFGFSGGLSAARAPQEMVCISFRVPADVAFDSGEMTGEEGSAAAVRHLERVRAAGAPPSGSSVEEQPPEKKARV